MTITLTSQAVGPEADAAKDRALSIFKDKIIQDLFNPAPNLAAPASSIPGLPGGGGQTTPSIVTLSLKAKTVSYTPLDVYKRQVYPGRRTLRCRLRALGQGAQ